MLNNFSASFEDMLIPDIVSYGKMLTGGYLTMAATLTSKKMYDSFLGKFNDWKHLFHGHTYTGNPIAAALANENLKMYQKYHLIKKIQKTSKIFEKFYHEISEIDIVGDIRHKGMQCYYFEKISFQFFLDNNFDNLIR